MSRTCTKCGDLSNVVDSRPSGDVVRRRRECATCGYRWTTYELREQHLDEQKLKMALLIKMEDLDD